MTSMARPWGWSLPSTDPTGRQPPIDRTLNVWLTVA
jgi:hypothetical protein